MTLLLSFVSSVLGAFIAAFVAHYLATERMRRSELSKFKLTAYTDFIGAAARLAVTRRIGETSNEILDLAALNDSKTRILIAGDRIVVEALSAYWELGGTLEKEEEIIAFNHLSSVMRGSLGYRKFDILELNISKTLFKLEPSTFSFRASQAIKTESSLDSPENL